MFFKNGILNYSFTEVNLKKLNYTKKNILLVILSLQIIFIVNQEVIASIDNNFHKDQSSQLKIYHDEIYGFSIGYPSDWEYKKSNNLGQYNILFFPQLMRAMVEVKIMEFPQTSLTTDEERLKVWTHIIRDEYSKDPSKIIINYGKTIIANQDATYITYLDSVNGIDSKTFETSIVIDNIVYTIIFASSTEDYDKIFQTVSSMISSFQVGR